MKILVALGVSVLSVGHAPAQGVVSGSVAAPAANYGKLPLSFEAKQGQADPQVRCLSHGSGYSLFLTDSAAVLALTKGSPSKKIEPGRVAILANTKRSRDRTRRRAI